jgi:hypothetical protein
MANAGGGFPVGPPTGASVLVAHQPRMKRDELRAMFVEAGLAILHEEGLGGGADMLTFKRVRERVESTMGIRTTNASIIGRIWANQYEFQTDVLEIIAADESNSEVEATMEDLAPVLAHMDPSSEESRRSTMREVCRRSAAANSRALRQSTDWALWVGVLAVTAAGAPTGGAPTARRLRLEAALEQSFHAVTQRMERIYKAGMDFVGYRIRPGLTVRQFTIAVAALAEGCVLRERVDSASMNGIRRPTGPDGEDQIWTVFGLALEALSNEFFELDPDWVPSVIDADSVSGVLRP